MSLVHQRWLLSDCYTVVTISVDLQVATHYERLTERLLTVMIYSVDIFSGGITYEQTFQEETTTNLMYEKKFAKVAFDESL